MIFILYLASKDLWAYTLTNRRYHIQNMVNYRLFIARIGTYLHTDSDINLTQLSRTEKTERTCTLTSTQFILKKSPSIHKIWHFQTSIWWKFVHKNMFISNFTNQILRFISFRNNPVILNTIGATISRFTRIFPKITHNIQPTTSTTKNRSLHLLYAETKI